MGKFQSLVVLYKTVNTALWCMG